jgi:hypothetical protein
LRASPTRGRAARPWADPPTAWTIADAMIAPLKRGGDALDTCREMRMQELKLRVQRADYDVDPVLVAEAMLRHAVSHRRCWKPRIDCATPSDSSTTSGGPSRTEPTQANGAASCAAPRSASAKHATSS